MGLYLLNRIERNTHYDKVGRAAEEETHAEPLYEPPRHKGHKGKENGPWKCNPAKHRIYVLGRSYTRPYAGHEPTHTLHVVGDILWVEDDRGVEVGEEDDEEGVETVVERAPGLKPKLQSLGEVSLP